MRPAGNDPVALKVSEIELESMFCTKCGVKLLPGAAICSRCGARLRPTLDAPSKSSLPKKLGLTALGCLIVFFVGMSVIRNSFFTGRSSGADLLEAAHSVRPHSWRAASADLPATSLMYLPKADAGFVGSWGGDLRVQPAAGEMKYVAAKVAPASYYFGERNGVVFISTNVYGDPQWPVVKTGVKVLNSRSIEFRIDSICKNCSLPERQQEVTRLTLVNPKEVDAEVYTYGYRSSDGHVELTYKGRLHLLTPSELAAINREVEQSGKLLTRIDSKVSVDN